MVSWLDKLRLSTSFQNFITFVIVLAGVLVGAETYDALANAYQSQLDLANDIILAIFVIEIGIKVGAEGKKPWRYFLDPWNVFDFLIVAVCFLPADTGGAAVLRLARLLRVLKSVRALPKLQILVNALLKSIPSMGYVSLLLALLFYLYAVAATTFFGANDPIHFDNLHLSMVSLFRVVTLEDWTDVMYIQMYGCANYGYDSVSNLCTQSTEYPVFGALFFISFVLIGAMVILNLFVGVIMTAMEEAQNEQEAKLRREALVDQGDVTVTHQISVLHSQIAALSQQLEKMEDLLRRDVKP